ncbi:putative Serine/threonine-protein phosphatase 4 regulatory subunit 1 [Hypsibius exemplaris]|uniref:Serine/threonine-protein phosphatase 4 regulatory subunit 1 n=1 Tax=Hypsibius exemplaris TaxID=2072580 RepID=A0A1W0XDH8_HYPEX|nr:putative Serine/threonine-protein phosphatase 4 regulatory subunit 1 [Hypsibius exemplaris]
MTETVMEIPPKEPDPPATTSGVPPVDGTTKLDEEGLVEFEEDFPALDAPAPSSGTSPPSRGQEAIAQPSPVLAEPVSPPTGQKLVIGVEEEEMDVDEDMEYETGLLDDLEDEEEEDEVITFSVPSPPTAGVAATAEAKPGDSSATEDDGLSSANADQNGTSTGRLRALSMNANLTLNLQPQQIALPSSPSRDGSSSPTMGRFKVTTCQPESTASPPRKDPVPNIVTPPEPDPPQAAAPQQKDERLMTPLERMQLYIDNPNMMCRNGVAVQYVNFIKDAEDPEAFVAASARLFDRLIQDQELSVRTAFLENLPSIVRSYKPAFKKLRMMGFLGESIRDENYNVRRLAQVAIGQLVDFAPELMTRETIQASVVPLLIQIFYAESTADLMIDALNLFCKMLDKVGPDPVRRLFIPEFNKLCSHDIAQIRQVCAQNLVFVVRYFAVTQAEEFQEEDVYCRAVQDKIIQLSQDFAWHVRETVASIFPQVIDICHKRWPVFTLRQLNLAYSALLNDQAKQVRRWATRGLGRVIATNAEPGKTRLHISSNGTVEFIPPTSFRFSDSDLGDLDGSARQRSSPSTSEGDYQHTRTRGRSQLSASRSTLGGANPGHLHPNNGSDQPRRNYYNRLGISSLSHALNEAGKEKTEERPDFNSFRFWQNPIPEVAVTDGSEVPVVLVTDTASKPEDERSEGKSDRAGGLEPVDLQDVKVEAVEDMKENADDVLNTSMELEDDESAPPEQHPEAIVHELSAGALIEAGSGGDVDVAVADQDAIRNKVLDDEISEEGQKVLGEVISHEIAPGTDGQPDISPSHSEDFPELTEKALEKMLSPDSDDTRSVSSASSNSQDLAGVTFTIPSSVQTPFASSFEIDPFIIEKHRRRDRAVVAQLKEAGELAGHLEDILPNVQFLREFLALAKDSDRDTVTQVAVDFPAVALTVGRQFWPELQECHKILATNNVIQARELIAASLPRIAEIIGYYHTVVDLVPLVSEFLKDTDGVRLNMIENYSAFIMRMPPEIRPLHLLRLCEFFTPDEERNWRYRYACAEQIAHLALLFPPKLVVRNLMDGAWFFAKDRTAEVRKNSTIALSSIFMRIEQQRDQASRNVFLQKLDLFLRNEDFRSRQVFAQICEDLLSKAALSFESFSLYFGDRFWPLFDSPVVAVRLAAARCLIYIPTSGRKQTFFGKAMEKLQRDESRTIQEMYTAIGATANTGSSTAGN